MSSLPETQTPLTDSLTPNVKNLLQEPPSVWGKLVPTVRTMPSVDLDKPTFLLGRDPNCDVVITDEIFSVNRTGEVSKVHFRIELNLDNLIYITDLSKNGTRLNNTRIGPNKKCILQHDDEIGITNLRVYVFKRIHNSHQDYLPKELRHNYEVSAILGEGACGEVRLIFDKYTCRPFACKKIIKSHGSKKLNLPENIKKEVDILKQLNHPFLISVKEIAETPTAFYIIMEYMEGGVLSHLIHSPKPLTEPQVKYLFYQIVIAVQHLHDINITHRDLKPENILLKNDTKDDNMVKVSDFGLSKMVTQESMMKTLCGTPYFTAPEILDSSVKTYGKKVDVWSLGVILYNMFAQHLPFRASSTIALCKMILAGKYSMSNPLWTEISMPPKDLIRKMLVRDPKKRLNIDQVVNHQWFAQDEPLQRRIGNMLYTDFKTRPLESDSEETTDSEEDKLRQSKRIKLSQEVVESSNID